jgi:hypothetical protein
MHLKQGMDKKRAELEEIIAPSNRVSRVITIIGGTLYASVRLVILCLAIIALRKVPVGVYATTWTRFLPNIS